MSFFYRRLSFPKRGLPPSTTIKVLFSAVLLPQKLVGVVSFRQQSPDLPLWLRLKFGPLQNSNTVRLATKIRWLLRGNSQQLADQKTGYSKRRISTGRILAADCEGKSVAARLMASAAQVIQIASSALV